MSDAPDFDHLFRHTTAQVVAALTRELGAHRIDQGAPANPRGWLYRVARNRALDVLRGEANLDGKLAQLAAEDGPPRAREYGGGAHAHAAPSAVASAGGFAGVHGRAGPGPLEALEAPFADAELALVFLCCHPRLSLDSRIALTLKLAGGFTVDEVAAAFLAEPATMAQRLVRAKKALAGVEDVVELTDPGDVAARLDSVLEALYLLFNEGYETHAGSSLIRPELCSEAIRLTRLIAGDARTALPHAHALLALMLFQASRLPARVDADGQMVLLADQDRARWDRALIAEAFHHFDQATTGDRLTSWHVQAAIAATYAGASDWAHTDWATMLMLHEQLYEIEPTPVVALNRAIVLAQVHGPAAGMEAALPLLEHPAMRRYVLLPATLAAFAEELGDADAAATYYRTALRLPCNDVERRFLEQRLARVRG